MSVGDVHSTARGSGARYNEGKPPLHLIPLSIIADSLADTTGSFLESAVVGALSALGEFQVTGSVVALDDAIEELQSYWRDCAAVFDYGRAKYAEWNWAKGMAWSIPLACAARHALWVLADHEGMDRESSLPHVGHMLCNLVMLRTYVTTYPEGNDLPPARLFDDRRPILGGDPAEEHHAVEAPMPPFVPEPPLIQN